MFVTKVALNWVILGIAPYNVICFLSSDYNYIDDTEVVDLRLHTANTGTFQIPNDKNVDVSVHFSKDSIVSLDADFSLNLPSVVDGASDPIGVVSNDNESPCKQPEPNLDVCLDVCSLEISRGKHACGPSPGSAVVDLPGAYPSCQDPAISEKLKSPSKRSSFKHGANVSSRDIPASAGRPVTNAYEKLNRKTMESPLTTRPRMNSC